MDNYKPLYQVYYLVNGELIKDFETYDKESAIDRMNELRSRGLKQVHIQYAFRHGGVAKKYAKGGSIETPGLSLSDPTQTTKYAEGGIVNIPAVLGKSIELEMPNGEVRRGQFAVTDLFSIKASHNEKTFQSTEGYPLDANGENINDRDYKADVNAQQKVREFSQNLRPNRLITNSVTPSGSPIINENGIVVSGNNRTMSLKLAVSDFPEKYNEYKKYLMDEIYAYKIPESAVEQFEYPVLVRIDYDIPALNTLELSKYNKDTKKSERPIDKAVKLGKILQTNERCSTIIGDIVGKYETFSDFYSNITDQKTLMETLINCNILTSQEKPMYFYERGFTEQGKEFVENLLVGLVLSKEALLDMNESVKKYRGTIITSLPVLSANSTLGEFSILDDLNKAITLEAKIVNSGLSFKDWINQINMFEGKPADNILYLNRLLANGRNKFKASIEGYNESVKQNQGESLFGDAPSKQDIFEAHVVSKIPDEDKILIQNSGTKSEINRSSSEQITKKQPMEGKNLFVDGNFFKLHPEKILATQETGSSRWGNSITLYKGSIDNLNKVDVSKDWMGAINNNPLISVIDTGLVDLTNKSTGAIDNINNAIAQSSTDIKKKRDRKSKENVEKTEVATSPLDGLETLSIKEVYNMKIGESETLNGQISLMELRVFLWWQSIIGRPINNPEWYELAEISKEKITSLREDPKRGTMLREWVDNGLVFYDGKLEKFVPAYLYLSGNVYEKYNRVVTSELSENTGTDAEYVIKEFGQKVYDQQVEAIRKLFQKKYEKRLVLTGQADDKSGLTLLPNAKFSKKFYIKSLIDERPFKWSKVSAQSDKRFGQPDWFKFERNDWKLTEFPELNLRDAFCYWIVSDKTVNVKQGITYSEIINYYILSKQKPPTKIEKTVWTGSKYDYSPVAKKLVNEENAIFERLKAKAKSEGDRLFSIFLNEFLLLNDRIRLETQWNMQYNNNVPIDTTKIPVAFRMNKFLAGQPLDVRPEKREAVAFTISNGSGLLAYDVGVGKTPSAIFTISSFIDMGYAKRPLVVVPNQTYKQWISEFKSFAGHLKINKMYNLNNTLIEEFQDTNGNTTLVEENSVTIMTYEGMLNLGFSDEVADSLNKDLFNILIQNTEGLEDKQREREVLKANTKVEELIGKALAKTKINLDELGFDYVCLDEAHACKKVFTQIAGEVPENTGNSSKESKSVVQYKISAGEPSSTAIKGFTICQYIQKKYNGNTQLLTATPFTNSPLEIYSMLAMIGYKRLLKEGLANLNTFFDTFVDVSYELVINASLNPERKQVILGFNNLLVLQQLVRQYILHKTGESVGVKRPNKWVLPLKNKKVDGVLMALPEKDQVNTTIPLSPDQAEYMRDIKAYAEGKISKEALGVSIRGKKKFAEGGEVPTEDAEGVELDDDVLTDDEKAGVRLLVALNHARNLALSPYLYEYNTLKIPSKDSYIKTSGKLSYVMGCIETIKDHHAKTKTPMSGIVIYMERGVEYFDLVREYLIENIGFKPHEVGIISSKQKTPVEKGTKDEEAKEYVKNLFLGKRFNKSTLELEPISDDERLKVLIGSATIREGINLQAYSSTLFNCFLSFNPTDIQQLEGRIYRQGNAFANVRIVNPIMIDSADIFMFQKLEEKTSRINSVFETDGHTNVLKTEEFDPKELKYSLVKDPFVLAKMEVIEDTEKTNEAISDLKNDIKKLENLKSDDDTIKAYQTQVDKLLKQYRPSSKSTNPEEQIKILQILFKNKLDEQGRLIVSSYRRGQSWWQEEFKREFKGKMELSPIYEEPDRPYWFDGYVLAVRNIKRLERDYLVPRGIPLVGVPMYIEKLKSEIEEREEYLKKMTSEEAIADRVRNIELKRSELNIKEKSVNQIINEFERTNYLLDDVKLPKVNKVISTSCPPVDAEGKPRIDAEGLKMLEECVKNAPNTKLLNSYDVQGDDGKTHTMYKPERVQLHNRIIEEMTGNAQCIKRDEPIAVLMGGAPGSGKSTFLKINAPYMTSDKIWKIDADEVRSKLPEYRGWNSPTTHEESKDVVNKLLDSFDQPCKHDLLYDGTMTNADKYKPIIKRLRKLGYKIFLVFMDIPKQKSIERALSRYRENNGKETEFGRYVPLAVIDDFYRTGTSAFEQLKAEADGYIKVDSLTQKIEERGGMQLPSDRPYAPAMGGKKSEKVIETVKPKKVEKEILSLSDVKEYLSTSKMALKYLEGDEKQTMKDYIDSLKMLIQIMENE
jgi:predicted ABC-type ATPase